MILRRAELVDMPDILGMAHRFHSESPVHGWLQFDFDQVRELITSAIDDPAWLPLVVYSDGELVGMALMVTLPTFFGLELECVDLTFYVDPGRRGGVAAARMLAAIVSWAGERGARRVSIAPNTGISHDKSVSFFERSGFSLVGAVLTKRL